MTSEETETPTIGEALRRSARVLREAGVDEARREAASLLAHSTGRGLTRLFTHDEERMTREEFSRLVVGVRRRAAGEPLQYIKGVQEFYGLDFEVTPAVLIPRPETELLVETALGLLRDARAPAVCDVGTGSGCVAVSLLRERADARGVALDLSPAALAVAARNAARHGVADRLTFIESDCFDALRADEPDPNDTGAADTGAAGPHAGAPGAGRFDLVVSNPPYIAEAELPGLQREVRDHEPRLALTPGGDGLAVIRRLVSESPRFLKAGGRLVFEIGFGQREGVASLVDPRVWTPLGVREDLQGIPRVVALGLRG